MKQTLIKGNGGKELTLFFHGWGMDARVLPFSTANDLLVIYDYTSLEFDNTLLSQYDTFNLIAWSMGVWAAERTQLPPLKHALAINGTPTPVHDTMGIPTHLFNHTLATLDENGLKRFNRRMCGDKERLQRFTPSARTLESLREELHYISTNSAAPSTSPKLWNEAIVGKLDLIFPFQNQLNYWKELSTITETPHYIW